MTASEPIDLVDSHCHLDGKTFTADRDAVVERALASGVRQMLAIGTGDGPPQLEAGIELAERYPCFVATVGVHPHDASKAAPETYVHLAELLKHPRVVAMGEMGLDYHYNFSPPDVQKAVFAEQMRIAADARKPIVIHTREAWADTFAMLEQHWSPTGLPCVLHCFTGGPAEAARAAGMGFYLAFGGVLTYPKSEDVREAARLAPLDRILLETDCPYLAPVPYRGKRNEPSYVLETAKRLAEVRSTTLAAIATQTTENFHRLINWGA